MGNYHLVRKYPSMVLVCSRLKQYRGIIWLPDKSVLEFRMIRCVEVIRNITAVGLMWRDIQRVQVTEVWRRAGTGRIGSMGEQNCSSPGDDRNPTADVILGRTTTRYSLASHCGNLGSIPRQSRYYWRCRMGHWDRHFAEQDYLLFTCQSSFH